VVVAADSTERVHDPAVCGAQAACLEPAVAVVVCEAVVEGGGEQRMNTAIFNRTGFKWNSAVVLAAVLFLPGNSTSVSSQAQEKSSSTSSAAAMAQKTFDSPQQAADALIEASQSYDVAALNAILGPAGRDLIDTGEPARDKSDAQAFATRAKEKNSVVIDPKNAAVATLVIGNEDWPTPIPIVKKSGKWLFDSNAARREILNRRIGEDELTIIDLLNGYVDAQREYSLEQHDRSGVNQYAQRIISTPGKQDGLAWQNADGSWGGPIGEAAAKAIGEGYSLKSDPFHGYYFKTLKRQGPAAPLGEMSYLVKGYMIGGYALVAVPAQYKVTGVNTFIVSNDGIVYEKILGPDGANIVQKMDTYNPDKTWTPVEPSNP
jgi:Protein of unknown function (DUF2950)